MSIISFRKQSRSLILHSCRLFYPLPIRIFEEPKFSYCPTPLILELIAVACSQYCGYAVILLQAFAFGHEFAEGLFLFAFQDGEGVENVGEFVAGQAVEMGDVGVDFRPQLGPVAGVAPVRGAVMDAAGG